MTKKPRNKQAISNSKKIQDIFNRLKRLETKDINIINLAFGAPGIVTPETVQKAAYDALKMSPGAPISYDGSNELRMEICDYIDRTRGFRPKLDQILIGPGVKTMIFTALLALKIPKFELITSNPGNPTYGTLSELLGAKQNFFPRTKEDDFNPEFKHLSRLLDKKNKIIIINTPHNPTGNVLSNIEVQDLSEIAQKKSAYIISDETYNQIIYTGHHTSPATIDHCEENTIIFENLNYAFGMMGWQISICIGPAKVIRSMKSIMVDTVPSVPNFIQAAGIEALRNYDKLVPEIIAKYKKCSETMLAGLNEIPGFECTIPGGTIFLFPDISGTGRKSCELAEHLLENSGVAVLPGELFGTLGENHLRISIATSIESINEGLTRLHESFKS